MIAIVDYGLGNLYSLQCSLRHIGQESLVTRDADALAAADRIILPGVGAFGDAIDRLRNAKLDGLLIAQARAGKPFLGICLGMQLLFDKSLEYGEHRGLGLIGGVVKPLPKNVKAPHMGWNSLDFIQPDDPLLSGVRPGDYAYYVHSYYAADCEGALVAASDYGVRVAGLVRRGNVAGAQFHPEKSGDVGLRILSAFCKEGLSC